MIVRGGGDYDCRWELTSLAGDGDDEDDSG